MKSILISLLLLTTVLLLWRSSSSCALTNLSASIEPRRLVSIKGKAMIVGDARSSEDPAATETIIFQKVGCETCFVGTNVSADGSYEVLVGDGKYRVIVHRPSAPEVDLLAPGQERFIDTESRYNSTGTFTFDIRIKFPT